MGSIYRLVTVLMWIFLIGFFLPFFKTVFISCQDLARYISKKFDICSVRGKTPVFNKHLYGCTPEVITNDSQDVKFSAEGRASYKNQKVEHLAFQGYLTMKNCVVFEELVVEGEAYLAGCKINRLRFDGLIGIKNSKVNAMNIFGSCDGVDVNINELYCCGEVILRNAFILGAVHIIADRSKTSSLLSLSSSRVDQDIIIEKAAVGDCVVKIILEQSYVVGKIIATDGVSVEMALKDSSCVVGGIEGSVTVTQA